MCIYTYIYIYIHGDLDCDFTNYTFRKTLDFFRHISCQRGDIQSFILKLQLVKS